MNKNEMLVDRVRNIVREPLPRPKRVGKTRKDAANGNKQRNHERKLARADWQQNSKNPAAFPV